MRTGLCVCVSVCSEDSPFKTYLFWIDNKLIFLTYYCYQYIILMSLIRFDYVYCWIPGVGIEGFLTRLPVMMMMMMMMTSWCAPRQSHPMIALYNLGTAPPWSSGSALDHRSLPSEFESRRGHIWRLFHLSLPFVTFGGRSAHLAYLVHKSGCKTPVIIIVWPRHNARRLLRFEMRWWWSGRSNLLIDETIHGYC